MKKILSFLLFLIIWVTANAQLDRDHWFAPMIDRTGNANDYQTLYISTNRTTPFPVSIYNNNLLIGTVTVSKGNPQKFTVDRNYIIATQQTDLFTPTAKGLYLHADYPFYANLRFSVTNHAEIITSKGAASTGTKFYAAMAPISADSGILNFMTGILATEDNTSVTISGYSPTIIFSNGNSGATVPTLSFTLNKGQSYILDGNATLGNNKTGFIGAKIVATKPVNITNGNFNGQYATSITTSSDILMDQSVPVAQLGNKFALVKGNGTIGSGMERAMVIATEDNTQIFVNNETAALATINEGQYFVIPDTKYISQGSGHYNLYITTTKNSYVYQLLAGAGGTVEMATGGFNFIPALNCYLPRQIDELGKINENFVVTNNIPAGTLEIPTKLNLITESGAVVLVNGVPPPANTGPFPMSGTANWVTYGVPNVMGNITVTSTKAITAGINAGSDAVGYGGFFAGFPTTPVILRTSASECVPGVTLTVDPVIYDTYQWYRNGVLIPGAASAAITPSQSGYYTASVTMGSCAPLVTAAYKVLDCKKFSTADYTVCTGQTITPVSSSGQSLVPSSVIISTAPAQGTASIDPTTGTISYSLNPGANGTDSFAYEFCGSDPDFPLCEHVTVNINIPNVTVQNTVINACETIANTGVFDLTTANVTSQTPVTITYYPTLIDAQNQNSAAQITNTTTYPATSGSVVYALVTTPSGCKKIANITLNVIPKAVLNNYSGTFCDDDLDGSITIQLASITPQVLANSGNFIIKYYQNSADANAGNSNTLPANFTFTSNSTIYIRVESPDGCPPVIQAVNLIFGAKIPLLKTTVSENICDNDLDGIRAVDLSTYLNQYTSDPAVTATFYTTFPNAQNNVNSLAMPVNITGTQTYYIRFSKNGVCANSASLTITVKTPKKSDVLKDQVGCANFTSTLDAGPGFSAYSWSTGATTASISNVLPGNYWVDLTFNGCVFRQYVTVSVAAAPVITAIDINNGTVTVNATGGYPPYEYSLDGLNWQSSNIFYNIVRGSYTAFVRDSLRCAVASREFSIIDLINAITPNDDGYNDVLDYSSLLTKENPELRIFDRYGAEIWRGSRSNRYIWDGKADGKPVSTATYWYIIEWTESSGSRLKYTSWLLVKNRTDHYFQK